MILANAGLYGSLAGAATMYVLGFLARGKSTRLLPALEAPPEGAVVTKRERARYYAAHGTALLLGLVAAGALYLLAPPSAEPQTWRMTDGVGWFLGPFFLVLAVGAATSPALLAWFVPPRALQVMLWRASRRMGRKDSRPLSVRLGLVIAPLALALHFALDGLHLRLGPDGVSWRAMPFGSTTARPWSDVRDVELVRTFEAMTGKVVERPHLRLRFSDGEVVEHGCFDTRAPAVWEDAAAYAAAQAGVPVRRVDK